MPSVSFRPHSISLLLITGGSYDENGDFVPGRESWSERIPCRYEPNGKARTVPVGEDKNYVYDYTVYLNTDCPDIAYGQKLRLFDKDGDCIGEYRSKGFHRGQLNAKTWV